MKFMMHPLYSFPRLNSNIFPLTQSSLIHCREHFPLMMKIIFCKVSGAFSLSITRGLIKESVQCPGTWILTSKPLMCILEFKTVLFDNSGGRGGGVISHLHKVNKNYEHL